MPPILPSLLFLVTDPEHVRLTWRRMVRIALIVLVGLAVMVTGLILGSMWG